MFSGEKTVLMGEKNRITVPADWARNMSSLTDVFAWSAQGEIDVAGNSLLTARLIVATERAFKALVGDDAPQYTPLQTPFRLASQNRYGLTCEQCALLGVSKGDGVTFVGKGGHFEIWSEECWRKNGRALLQQRLNDSVPFGMSPLNGGPKPGG